MSDTKVRIDYTISIGFVGAVKRGTFYIDREEWDEMEPTDREKYIEDRYEQAVAAVVDGNWTVVNADLNDPVKDGE
jgi:hypothetical protein